MEKNCTKLSNIYRGEGSGIESAGLTIKQEEHQVPVLVSRSRHIDICIDLGFQDFHSKSAVALSR